MMRILAIERDSSACNFYRILTPVKSMAIQGLAEVSTITERDLGTDIAVQQALWADIILFQRPHSESWFQFIKTCQKHGKLIVTDYDDDPFTCSPLNPYYQYIGTEPVEYTWPDGTKEMLWSEDMVSSSGEKIFNIEKNIAFRDMFRLNFKKADLITCTTEILRKRFLEINPNVAALPNLIDPSFWPQVPEFVKKEVRIGWQGGHSHYEDLFFILPVLEQILKKHSNAKFVYFGDYRFSNMFNKLPKDQVECHPWVPHNVYPYQMNLLNLDIGLCPVMEHDFNITKSTIKWLEYSMLGMSTVASNIPPYSLDITGDTGVLCSNDAKEWVDAIDKLVLDKSYRTKMGKTAFMHVMENHTIDKKAHLWIEAYESILKPKEVLI